MTAKLTLIMVSWSEILHMDIFKGTQPNQNDYMEVPRSATIK